TVLFISSNISSRSSSAEVAAHSFNNSCQRSLSYQPLLLISWDNIRNSVGENLVDQPTITISQFSGSSHRSRYVAHSYESSLTLKPTSSSCCLAISPIFSYSS